MTAQSFSSLGSPSSQPSALAPSANVRQSPPTPVITLSNPLPPSSPSSLPPSALPPTPAIPVLASQVESTESAEDSVPSVAFVSPTSAPSTSALPTIAPSAPAPSARASLTRNVSASTSSQNERGAAATSAGDAVDGAPATLELALAASSRSICPRGVPSVNCFMDPCNVAKCPGVQNARCVPYYCGGCNVLWYGPSGLIPASRCRVPTNPTSKCPIGEPLKNSQGVELFCGRGPNRVDCPPGTTCEVDPTDRFAVCCAPGDSSCPRGTPTVNCFVDPCMATSCPGVKDAKCVANYCGGCNALWYNPAGGLLTAAQCRRPSQASTCPPGVPLVQCFVDPCSVTNCPGVKDANCTADYCGGCNAIWKNAAGTVLSEKQCSAPVADAKCPAGELALVNSKGEELFCGRGPNRVECPPGSLCAIDPRDRFAVCCSSSSCPPDAPTVNCFVNPCQFAECPGVEDARCVANYCGGCNALWFTASGGVLTESECQAAEVSPCPDGVPEVQCFVDPCTTSDCPNVKDAKCTPNYCGGCNAVWSDPDGNVLTDAMCQADNSKCPSGGVVVRDSQGADLFCGRGPSRVDCPPSSTCVIDPADRFAVCCQGPQCPAGVPVVQCFVDPCSVASCPKVRDARCVSNYCGGCNALWYHPNGGLLSDSECRAIDAVSCPPDKPAVVCYVDPCLLASCPGVQGARCIPDYCGGCKAQWYGPTGNLLTSRECELVPGPVRYLDVRMLSADTEAIATWVAPNGTFCGLPYVAEMSYDGRAWSALPLEQPFSMFSKFTVTPRKQFQVRVAAQRGPSVMQTFKPKKGKN